MTVLTSRSTRPAALTSAASLLESAATSASICVHALESPLTLPSPDSLLSPLNTPMQGLKPQPHCSIEKPTSASSPQRGETVTAQGETLGGNPIVTSSPERAKQSNDHGAQESTTANSLDSASSTLSPSAPLPLDPSSLLSAPAFKPATGALMAFQNTHVSKLKDMDPSDPKYQFILNTYLNLRLHSNVERIDEACVNAANPRARASLTKDLNKAINLLYREFCRNARDQAAKEREQRRIQRDKEREERHLRKQRDAELKYQRRLELAKSRLEKLNPEEVLDSERRHRKPDIAIAPRNILEPRDSQTPAQTMALSSSS